MVISVREIAKFGLFGAILYAQKVVLASLPNIHLCAVILCALTVVYRWKALYPLYVYVLLEGLFGGFTAWWISYLYVWTILWAVVMLLPGNLPQKKIAVPVYMAVCAVHGFSFGALTAPPQALVFGMNWQAMLAWIAAGFSFDMIHGISNFCLGILVVPLIRILQRMERSTKAAG